MTRHAKPPTISLPTTWLEAEAVDTIAGWIDRVADLMTSEEGRRRLRESIGEKLREGAVSRMQVIAAAKAGDQDADIVLRELGVEFISRRLEPPTELAEYMQWALLHPSVSSGGRNTGDYWKRDIGIGVLATLAQQRWPQVPKTRNRHSKRAGDGLSISLLISHALGRRGINLEERGVETVLGARLEAKLARRLSVFLPG